MIDARLGVKVGEAVNSVRSGRRDVAVMGSGYAALARLRRRDPAPIRDTVSATTMWVFLNTRVPPFNDVNARRAVSLALDRRAVVAAAGGKDVVTCHLIPPGLPGYRPGCPAGGPDLAQARRLVTRSETRGARVTVWHGAGFEPLTGVLTRTLHSLGYRTRVRRLAFDPYWARVTDPKTRAQIGSDVWQADYPSTSTFLDRFSCRSFEPDRASGANSSQYCDPRVDDLMRRATAQATDPRAADALWARAERRLLAAAPIIPVLSPVHTDLVSKRVRNDQYHAQWGLLLDQVSVR